MASIEPAHEIDARKALAWSRDHVVPALRAAIDTLPADMRRVAGYHLGWWDEQGQPVESDGGKSVRPALVLLTAEAVGGPAENAIPAAVAVELVHNFSLLHDDVIDGDATRRHRATAWRVFGVNAAILAGDALLTLASEVLSASEHHRAGKAVRLLSATVQTLIQGQILDLAFERRGDVSVAECQRMAEAKTGALLGVACELGVMFGDGSDEQREHLRSFGQSLGLAFQHVDDLLGIWGDPDRTGKPAYSDLRARKKSLPVVLALNSRTAAGRVLATRYHHGNGLSDEVLTETAKLVEDAGGRAWCLSEAHQLLARALHHLHATGPVARTVELDAIAHIITFRDR